MHYDRRRTKGDVGGPEPLRAPRPRLDHLTPEEKAERRRALARAWSKAHDEKRKEARRKWMLANPDKQIAARRAWELANGWRKKKSNRAWQKANAEKMNGYRRKAFAKKLAARAGRPRPENCEICDRPHGKYALHFDHDHATDAFRGWICHGCNAALGGVADRIDILERLIAYLVASKRPKLRRIL